MPPCPPDGCPDRCPARAPRTPVPGAGPCGLEGRVLLFRFQVEGQIQTGKQRTVTQGIPLSILFETSILLKGDIGDSQPGTRGECAEIVRAAGRSGRAASFFVQCRIPPCVDWRIAPPHHPMPWGERRPRRDTGVPEHVRGGSPSFFRGAFWIGPGKGRNVWILRLHFVWRAAIMRIRGTHWEELDPWNIRPYRSPE